MTSLRILINIWTVNKMFGINLSSKKTTEFTKLVIQIWQFTNHIFLYVLKSKLSISAAIESFQIHQILGTSKIKAIGKSWCYYNLHYIQSLLASGLTTNLYQLVGFSRFAVEFSNILF